MLEEAVAGAGSICVLTGLAAGLASSSSLGLQVCTHI